VAIALQVRPSSALSVDPPPPGAKVPERRHSAERFPSDTWRD
jgi:hypothetical protein